MLESGGRGYKYVCLSMSLHADHNTSASAYVMLAAAISTTDCAKQAEHIEVFVIWSVAVNVKKRTVTGIL